MLFRSNDTATTEIYTTEDTLSLHDALPISAQRMLAFEDIDAVDSTLQTLAAHADGALVQCLPREPGKRESRWMHCLAEADAESASAAAAAPGAEAPATATTADDLEQRVARLERIVADLSARLGHDDTDA